MLGTILEILEEHFPRDKREISQPEWETGRNRVAAHLQVLMDEIYSRIALVVPDRFYKESKIETLVSNTWMPLICHQRWRPQNRFYKGTDLAVPRPENPGGVDATGLELSFGLMQGFRGNGLNNPPYLLVNFSVWGTSARFAFLEMVRDHRRFVESLVDDGRLEFSSSRIFENVEADRGESSFRKLELYAENEDEEACFAFEWLCFGPETIDELVSCTTRLVALYDACHGYLRKKPKTDRPFEWISMLRLGQSNPRL